MADPTPEEISKGIEILHRHDCPDCGVSLGYRHSENCDVGRCSLHGTDQYIFCQFCWGYDEGDNEIIRFPERQTTVWRGEWPNVLECREFGYWTSNPIYLAKGQDRTEDLNSFIMDCHRGLFRWDVEQERWFRNGS